MQIFAQSEKEEEMKLCQMTRGQLPGFHHEISPLSHNFSQIVIR